MNRYERQTGSPDANEAAIVAELQQRGAIVVVLDRPVDLLVGCNERWVLVEVKDGPKASIRPSQREFLTRCALQNLPSCVIRSMADLDHYFPILLPAVHA